MTPEHRAITAAALTKIGRRTPICAWIGLFRLRVLVTAPGLGFACDNQWLACVDREIDGVIRATTDQSPLADQLKDQRKNHQQVKQTLVHIELGYPFLDKVPFNFANMFVQMPDFSHAIRPFVDLEIAAAKRTEAQADLAQAFHHLERAHVIAQASTTQHVRVHWQMLLFSLRRRQLGDGLGQVLRLIGAATKTAIGLVPSGNTGGSNISPFKRLPIAPELQHIIDMARQSEC